MLSTDELRQLMGVVTYRPGWEFSIEDGVEGPYLRIVAPVENSYGGGKTDLGIDTYLSPNDRRDETSFLNFLLWRMLRIESHEAREWLQVSGVPIFDPHT